MRSPLVAAALPFVNGGAAGMIATSIIQPVDMVKVRAHSGSRCGRRAGLLRLAFLLGDGCLSGNSRAAQLCRVSPNLH